MAKVMKVPTVKFMAKECKRIWKEVLDKELKLKPDTDYENDCPACQYVSERNPIGGFTMRSNCAKCPLLELWGGKDWKKKPKGNATPCEDWEESPYKMFKIATDRDPSVWEDDEGSREEFVFLRREAARQIIGYLERKFKV